MPRQLDIDRMLNEVRRVIARYGHLPKRDVYESLCSEAEGWKMRLEELGDGDDQD
jgi:hypothetical protein